MEDIRETLSARIERSQIPAATVVSDVDKRRAAELAAGVIKQATRVEPVAASTKVETNKKMSRKPKTIAGKILKGAAIGIGGAAVVATGVGAIGGAVGGAGLLAGAAKGIGTLVKGAKAAGGGVKTVLSKVSAGAAKLVTGQSAEERAIVKEAKAEAKEAKNKLDLVKKLQKTGLTESEARQRAGLSESELPTINGVPTSGMNKTVVYAGIGLLALVLLPKLFKR